MVKLSYVISQISGGLFAFLLCVCFGGANWTLGGGPSPSLRPPWCLVNCWSIKLCQVSVKKRFHCWIIITTQKLFMSFCFWSDAENQILILQLFNLNITYFRICTFLYQQTYVWIYHVFIYVYTSITLLFTHICYSCFVS